VIILGAWARSGIGNAGKQFLAIAALGGGFPTASAALADVQVLSLRSVPSSDDEGRDGIRPSPIPVTNSNTTTRYAGTAAGALIGLTASHAVNAISGTGTKQAVATDTETTLAQVASDGVGTIDFTGGARGSV